MTILLDTHVALWYWWDDPRLSHMAKEAIRDAANRKLISTASCWEIAIKVSLKKLDLGVPYRGFIHEQMVKTNFEPLPIGDEHMARLAELPFHHRDPLDRRLVAQAIAEGIPIVSGDVQLDAYGAARIW